MKKDNSKDIVYRNEIVFRDRIGEQLSIFEDGETEYLYSERIIYVDETKLKRRKPNNED